MYSIWMGTFLFKGNMQLGVFLDSQLLFIECGVPLVLFSRLGTFQTITYALSDLMAWIWKWILHGLVLEDHLEASVCLECSSMSRDEHASICLCNNSAFQAALMANLFLNEIQAAYKALHGIGPGCLPSYLPGQYNLSGLVHSGFLQIRKAIYGDLWTVVDCYRFTLDWADW